MTTEPPTPRTWEEIVSEEAALWNARIDLPDLDLGSYGTNTWRFAPQRPFRFGALVVDGPPGVRVLSFQVAGDELLVGPKVPIEHLGPASTRGVWFATMGASQIAELHLQNVAKAGRLLRGVVFGNYLT